MKAKRRLSLLIGALVAASVPLAAGAPLSASAAVTRAAAPGPTRAANLPPLMIGEVSTDWNWTDANAGPVSVYRNFDIGWHFATWKATDAYKLHPNAPQNDYSFQILPQKLSNPADPMVTQLKAFLATTPKNIVVTNYHEPDDSGKYHGAFTQAQFRAGIVALAGYVRAQNAVDGGTRKTSVILMNVTFGDFFNSKAIDWWPTDTRDGGHADQINVDAYALPHNTGTGCCPQGYTDGINWKTGTQLLTNVHNFAVAQHTDWAISELGYLEDIHNPMHKSQAMAQVVDYARANGALWVSYFDAKGPRADWRLRNNNPPIPSTSTTSNAVTQWKSLAAAALTTP